MRDEMPIQTLKEHCFGANWIISAYTDRNWILSTDNKICHHIDLRRLVAAC